MPGLTSVDGVYILHLGNDQNRFTLDWLGRLDAALDEVMESPAPLVTIGSSKYYSTGLDVEWLRANPDQHQAHSEGLHSLVARMLSLPVPTVAAVSGHAFGAGALLATAHDWRVMTADRGYFCLPEIDLSVAPSAGMVALIQSKFTPQAALAAITTGHRFTASAALEMGMIDDATAAHDLLATAVARAGSLAGKDPTTLGTIKALMFGTALERLAPSTDAGSGSDNPDPVGHSPSSKQRAGLSGSCSLPDPHVP